VTRISPVAKLLPVIDLPFLVSTTQNEDFGMLQNSITHQNTRLENIQEIVAKDLE